MSDERPDPARLTTLLDHHAADVVVGPPPMAELGSAAQTRRRGWGLAAVVGGLVAASVLPVALLLGNDDGVATTAPTAGATITASAGTRLFGLGPVILQVPQDWTRNDLWCGEPISRRPDDLGPTRAVTVDGMAAEVEEVACVDKLSRVLCSATIWFPEAGIGVIAESSTDVASVEEILGMVRVASNVAGVPSPDESVSDLPPPSPERHVQIHDAYLDELERFGFTARTEAAPRPVGQLGQVTRTEPIAGEVVPVGSEVVVHVTTGPDGVLPR